MVFEKRMLGLGLKCGVVLKGWGLFVLPLSCFALRVLSSSKEGGGDL